MSDETMELLEAFLKEHSDQTVTLKWNKSAGFLEASLKPAGITTAGLVIEDTICNLMVVGKALEP